MRNFNALKERYLQDDLPIRLGNLAANLARIKSRCLNSANNEMIKVLLQESKILIEWTAKDFDIEIAAELVNLQLQIAQWQYHWDAIKDNTEQRMQVSEAVKIWSDKVLNMSGLLSVN